MKLYNRDGAHLELNKIKDIDEKISEWKLTVDQEHEYCLQFMRIIGDWEAIDPSGGPFISVGDKLGNYKIIKIINPTILWLSEESSNI